MWKHSWKYCECGTMLLALEAEKDKDKNIICDCGKIHNPYKDKE